MLAYELRFAASAMATNVGRAGKARLGWRSIGEIIRACSSPVSTLTEAYGDARLVDADGKDVDRCRPPADRVLSSSDPPSAAHP
jgi:hypothetical protein